MIVPTLITKDLYRIQRAVKRTVRQIFVQRRNMPRRCALEATQVLRGNINKQAYAPYQSYTDKYAKWKRQHGYPNMFWKLSGDLIRNIKTHRISHTEWMAGISDSAMGVRGHYSGNLKRYPIAKYARVLEYGGNFGRGGRHPARPVFRPTAKDYRRSLMPKQADKSLGIIASKWR